MKRIVFVDFDGTITQQDTCAAMVEAFASEGWQEIDDLWEKRLISTEECANRTFQLFNASSEDIKQLLDTIELDEGFLAFIDYCRTANYPLYILSDGYDFCIKHILGKYQIKLPYFANKLELGQGFSITCTYHNGDCGKCGTCKRSLMEHLAEPGVQRVYVGDGTSDLCAASHADLVFAKGKLLQYCLDEGIAATPFLNFNDIRFN